MKRNKGDNDLINLKKGGVLVLKKHIDFFNRQVAKRQKCDEKSIRNMRYTIFQTKKKNRDPINSKIHKSHSRIERFRVFNKRDARCIIRYIIKNKVNRRKP